jgi:hypothetical protein
MAVTPPPDRLEPTPPRKGKYVNGIFFDTSPGQATSAFVRPGQQATGLRKRTAQEIALSDYITKMNEARNKRVIGDDQEEAAKRAFNFMVTEPIKSMGRTISGQNARTALDPRGGFRPLSRLFAVGEDAINIATAIPAIRGAKYLATAPLKAFARDAGETGAREAGETITRYGLAERRASQIDDEIKSEYARLKARQNSKTPMTRPEWDEDIPEGTVRFFHTNPSGSRLPYPLLSTEDASRIQQRRGGSGATNIYSGGLYGTRAGDVSASYGDDVMSSAVGGASIPDFMMQGDDFLDQPPTVSGGWDDTDPLGNPMGMNTRETNEYIKKLRMDAYRRNMLSPDQPLAESMRMHSMGSLESALGLNNEDAVIALMSIPETGLSERARNELRNLKRMYEVTRGRIKTSPQTANQQAASNFLAGEEFDRMSAPLARSAAQFAGNLPISTVLNILPEKNVRSFLNGLGVPIVFRPQSPQRFNFAYPIVRSGEDFVKTGIAGPNNPLYVYGNEATRGGARIARDIEYSSQISDLEKAWTEARQGYLGNKYNDPSQIDDLIGINPYSNAILDRPKFQPRFRNQLPGQNYFDLPYEGNLDRITSVGGMPSFDLRSLTQEQADFLADKMLEWATRTNPYLADDPSVSKIIENIRSVPNSPSSTSDFYRYQNQLLSKFPESGIESASRGAVPGWEGGFEPKENLWNFLRDAGVSNVPHHGGMLTGSPRKHTSIVFNNPELLPPANYIEPTTQKMNDLLSELARQQAIMHRAGRPSSPAFSGNAGSFLNQIYGGYLGGQALRQSPQSRRNIR